MKRKLGLAFFLSLILWIAVIFYFSSQPSDISSKQSNMTIKVVSVINNAFDFTDSMLYQKATDVFKDMWFYERLTTRDLLVRKTAHFGIYFVLGIFAAGFGYLYSRKIPMGFLLGFSLPVVIAVLDEFNQGSVGRNASIDDVMIDGAGAICGAATATIIILCFKMVVLGWGILRGR